MRPLTILLVLALALPAAALDLSGRILDADGKALSNAYVYVFTALPKVGLNTICPSCYRDCGKREKVAANGSFKLRGLDGTLKFQLLAVADGYEPTFSRYVASGPVTLTLERRDLSDDSRLVRGVVLEPTGKPAVGAIVEPQGVRIGRSTGYGKIAGLDPLSITNGEGLFVLRVPEKTDALDVRVRARNFAPEIARNFAPGFDGHTVRVDVGASVAGRLVCDGSPAGGVRVGFDHKDRRSRNFLGRESIGTDEKGFFLITGLGPEEEYYVFLDDDQRIPVEKRGKLVKVGGDGSALELGDVELK